MKKLEYIYSPENLIRESLHNRFFNVFEFEYVVDKLKTKKSIRDSEVLDFQNKLIKTKNDKKKRIYKEDVVLEMEIRINQKNAPSIQNIPKCYIDLLWRPSKDIKKSLILIDDDQIKYLTVNYKKSTTENSSIFFRIFPYKRFLKDIELLIRLKRGIFKYEMRSIEIDEEDEYEEQHNENHNFYELRDHVKSKEFYIKKHGEDEYYYWEFYYKRIVQETELNNQRIKNQQILDQFRKSIVLDGPFTQSKLGILDLPDIDDLIEMVFDILGDLKLPNLPIESGEGKLFLKELEGKVDAYFAKRWFYFPLLVPISLTIYILQPKEKTKDFDNLAKWVLPLYMKKLNPPSSFEQSLQEIEKLRLTKYSDKESFSQSEGEFPKNGIMSYQIIQLPRTENSPDKGFIKVNFHNAFYFRSFVDFIPNQISKYESNLE